jgi:murein L,D-transpeptidase YcbB/YkuD
MFLLTRILPVVLGISLLAILNSCNNNSSKDIAATPEQLQEKTQQHLVDWLNSGSKDIADSITIANKGLLELVYEQNAHQPLWSKNGQWIPVADSLVNFINKAKYFALFPEDYFDTLITAAKTRITADSLGKSDSKDANLWFTTDVLLTNAVMQLITDLKQGRLPNDSVSLRKDSVLAPAFYQQQLTALLQTQSPTVWASALEPQLKVYAQLKKGLHHFLQTAAFKKYTKIPASAKGADSAVFFTRLQTRLYEGGYIAADSVKADSSTLAAGIKKFQKDAGLAVDGKAGEVTIRMLNLHDQEKFMRIAITADRYKLLPEKLPEQYIWVNIPSFNLQLLDNDTLRLASKVICGKPKTRTPVLTSKITNMVTYPQWTVPTSIIVKEILPQLKKNPGYLARKNFSLINAKGDEVDPFSVDWSKYSKGIPYRVVQGSGDANSLGVLKFNFNNKYAVYLHDTNQRYLFGQAYRAMSHGCVRVQEWRGLMNQILRWDSVYVQPTKNFTRVDSVDKWLSNKEKKGIAVKKPITVFIRYFTCEGNKDGQIVFYDDVYGEDKWLREKYYAGK